MYSACPKVSKTCQRIVEFVVRWSLFALQRASKFLKRSNRTLVRLDVVAPSRERRVFNKYTPRLCVCVCVCVGGGERMYVCMWRELTR